MSGMKQRKGWVKIMRSFEDSRSFDHANATAAFVHCQLRANITDKVVKGVQIRRGQFITSVKDFADECGMSYEQMRYALQMLEKDGLIILENAPKIPKNAPKKFPKNVPNNATKNGTLITVVNYGFEGDQEEIFPEEYTEECPEEIPEERPNSIRKRRKNKEQEALQGLAGGTASPRSISKKEMAKNIAARMQKAGFNYSGHGDGGLPALVLSELNKGHSQEEIMDAAMETVNSSIRGNVIEDHVRYFLAVLRDE